MTKEIILSKGDFVLLSSFIKNHTRAFSDHNLKKLAAELENAKIVDKENLPKDAIRLNSEVKIIEQGQDKDITLKLVMPASADIHKNMISVFAPLSAALIGYRQGDVIEWEVPMGTRRFEILEVRN